MQSPIGMTSAELDDRFARLEALMKAESAETRRHFEVVAEGLQLEIRIIAEGHGALRTDVADLKAGQERLEGGMTRLETRQHAVEFRQGRLETRMDGLEQRQGRLEDRMDRLEDRQGRLEGRQAHVEEQQADLADGQRALVTEVRLLATRFPPDTSRTSNLNQCSPRAMTRRRSIGGLRRRGCLLDST